MEGRIEGGMERGMEGGGDRGEYIEKAGRERKNKGRAKEMEKGKQRKKEGSHSRNAIVVNRKHFSCRGSGSVRIMA